MSMAAGTAHGARMNGTPRPRAWPAEWLIPMAAKQSDTTGRQACMSVQASAPGCVWVTVWHGGPETSEEEQRLVRLAKLLSEIVDPWPGCVRIRQGGNDHWAVQFQPHAGAPAPASLAREFADAASEISPRPPWLNGGTWWRVTHTAPHAGPPPR